MEKPHRITNTRFSDAVFVLVEKRMLAVQKMPTSLDAACVGLGVSATLSLQTVHRTVCLTLVFEPRYLLLVY